MPFKRIATLDIKNVFAADSNGKFEWRSFVKQANEEPGKDRTNFLPKEAYKYDTENFLFLTARAISGMEKWGHNGNYDAFPWEEIKKAAVTYPGAGFYIEHKEDSADDAKGIVLDVFLNEDEQYLVALCAIDKKEYPEFCEQILDGTYNQVSMSCLASSCECSLCHNVATSYEQLCEHMNPQMPYSYMKGKKDDQGNDIYEINRDLNFTGLSAVAVPADKDAFVFDVKASKNKPNKLQEELHKYTAAKIADRINNIKKACQEEFASIDTGILLDKIKTSIDYILNTSIFSDVYKLSEPLLDVYERLVTIMIALNSDALSEINVVKKTDEVAKTNITEEAESVTNDSCCLDKELEGYLDGDNYSYTPFSSTASNKSDILDTLIEEYK